VSLKIPQKRKEKEGKRAEEKKKKNITFHTHNFYGGDFFERQKPLAV